MSCRVRESQVVLPVRLASRHHYGCACSEGMNGAVTTTIAALAAPAVLAPKLSRLDIGSSLADFDLLAQGNCIGRSAHANLHIVALDSEVFAIPICQQTRFQWNRHGRSE